MRFPRPCTKCGRKFTPSGKFCYICSYCKNRAFKIKPDSPKTMKDLREKI